MNAYDAVMSLDARAIRAERNCRNLGWSMIIAAVCCWIMAALYFSERHRPHPQMCPRPVSMELPGFAPPHVVTASRAVWPQQYVVGRRVWRA